MFQAGFAMVTVALIAGAVADRMRFLPWIAFTALWATLVYFPVAHWIFAVEGTTADKGGWLANLGVLDFAGGTAVEINSGAAGLALAIVLGKRRGWPREAMRPHNLPAVMLGAGLLWFGWFGFNAGSALAADGTAALVIANTLGAGRYRWPAGCWWRRSGMASRPRLAPHRVWSRAWWPSLPRARQSPRSVR